MDGAQITAKGGSLTFDDATKDVIADYTVNARRSLAHLQRRLNKHLTPYFGGRKMSTITTADVRAFQKHRKDAGASNGEINRELAILNRAFTLAVQSGSLLHRPYIPMLKEAAPRQGFFEGEQFESIRAHLPEHLQNLATVYHETGWRLQEVLPLEWRQIDFEAGTIRLDAGTTKNDEGRVIYFTDELKRALTDQHVTADRLKKAGIITRAVFFYTGARRAANRSSPSREPGTRRGSPPAAPDTRFKTSAEQP